MEIVKILLMIIYCCSFIACIIKVNRSILSNNETVKVLGESEYFISGLFMSLIPILNTMVFYFDFIENEKHKKEVEYFECEIKNLKEKIDFLRVDIKRFKKYSHEYKVKNLYLESELEFYIINDLTDLIYIVHRIKKELIVNDSLIDSYKELSILKKKFIISKKKIDLRNKNGK